MHVAFPRAGCRASAFAPGTGQAIHHGHDQRLATRGDQGYGGSGTGGYGGTRRRRSGTTARARGQVRQPCASFESNIPNFEILTDEANRDHRGQRRDRLEEDRRSPSSRTPPASSAGARPVPMSAASGCISPRGWPATVAKPPPSKSPRSPATRRATVEIGAKLAGAGAGLTATSLGA